MFPIQITTKNLELTKEIKDLITEKFSKLESRLSHLPADAITATVLLKKRIHQTKDNLYTTTIALNLPSATFHAHQEGYTLGESLIGAVDDIEDQLEKYQSKLTSS